MLDGESEMELSTQPSSVAQNPRDRTSVHIDSERIIVIAFLCTAKRLMCCFARCCIDKITHLAKCARRSPQPLTTISKSLYEQELVLAAAVTADDEQLTFSFLLLFVSSIFSLYNFTMRNVSLVFISF